MASEMQNVAGESNGLLMLGISVRGARGQGLTHT